MAVSKSAGTYDAFVARPAPSIRCQLCSPAKTADAHHAVRKTRRKKTAVGAKQKAPGFEPLVVLERRAIIARPRTLELDHELLFIIQAFGIGL